MLLCVGFPPKNTFRRMEELSERCGLSLGVGFRLFSQHESSFTASFNQHLNSFQPKMSLLRTYFKYLLMSVHSMYSLLLKIDN